MSPDSTRESLLNEAKVLLQSRGYDSFSFQDLADRVGIRKASVHSHFKDKEELGVRLVERYLEDFNAWMEFSARKGPAEQLWSFTRMIKRVYLVGEHLCANGAFFSDWGALPARMQKQALLLQNTQIDWAMRCLEEARSAGELRFEGPARLRAQQWFVTLIGALQAARAWNQPEVFDSLVRLCFQDLGWK